MNEMICIGCPMGCPLSVDMETLKVSGNACKIGAEYGIKEMTDPRRTVTSSVVVLNGEMSVVSVKTAEAIPKKEIFNCMEAIKKVRIKAPVMIGDIIIKNVSNTGIDVIATGNVI